MELVLHFGTRVAPEAVEELAGAHRVTATPRPHDVDMTYPLSAQAGRYLRTIVARSNFCEVKKAAKPQSEHTQTRSTSRSNQVFARKPSGGSFKSNLADSRPRDVSIFAGGVTPELPQARHRS